MNKDYNYDYDIKITTASTIEAKNKAERRRRVGITVRDIGKTLMYVQIVLYVIFIFNGALKDMAQLFLNMPYVDITYILIGILSVLAYILFASVVGIIGFVVYIIGRVIKDK